MGLVAGAGRAAVSARIDLISMRLVVLCAESGSLSNAARIVNCSISACSQRLAALEKSLGRRLFHRAPGGVSLTEDGELFVRHARRILSDFDQLLQQFTGEAPYRRQMAV